MKMKKIGLNEIKLFSFSYFLNGCEEWGSLETPLDPPLAWYASFSLVFVPFNLFAASHGFVVCTSRLLMFLGTM